MFRQDSFYQAINPAQNIKITFLPQSIELSSMTQAKSWHWTMNLLRYGFQGHLQSVAEANLVVADNRAEYRRGSLVEWYINKPQGLEQGFTLYQPPSGETASTMLVIELALSGNLVPHVTLDSQSLNLVTPTSTAQVTYGHLQAFDATGRLLPSHLESIPGQDGLPSRIQILVDTAQAVYPILIDPIVAGQSTSATATANGFGNNYNYAVSRDGKTLVVGTTDNALYIFVRETSHAQWTPQITLIDSGPFGAWVDISADGNTILTAANNTGSFAGGRVFICTRANGTWTKRSLYSFSSGLLAGSNAVSLSENGKIALVGDNNYNGYQGRILIFTLDNSGNWNRNQIVGNYSGSQAGKLCRVSNNTLLVDNGDSHGNPFLSTYTVTNPTSASPTFTLQQTFTVASNYYTFPSAALSGNTLLIADSASNTTQPYILGTGTNPWLTQGSPLAGSTVALSGNLAVIQSDSSTFDVFMRTVATWNRIYHLATVDHTTLGAPRIQANFVVSGSLSLHEVFTFDNLPSQPCSNDGKGDCTLNPSGQVYSPTPVELLQGEKMETITDLSLTAPTKPLDLVRIFRQTKQADARYQFMGLGWIHNHVSSLQKISGTPTTLLMQLPSGGSLYLLETPAGSGSYLADAGSTATAALSGSNYVVTGIDKAQYLFVPTATPGLYKLQTITWPSSDVWTYSYTSDVLASVSDDYGHRLQFSYLNTPGQFTDGQLWRVGDQTASGLSGTTPTGRYVEYSYSQTAAPIGGVSALLTSVRDVRGYSWGYSYDAANYLVTLTSPSVDASGAGGAGNPIILKSIGYTLDGTTVKQLVQSRGDGLIQTTFDFQPDGQNQTNETTAGLTTVHLFAGGVYAGPQDANGNLNQQTLNGQYRPTQHIDANNHTTALDWTNDGGLLNSVTDALGNLTRFTYNQGGASDGTLSTSIDAQGRQTRYAYSDANNPRLPTEVRVLDTDGLTALRWQRFSYDHKGRTLTEQTMDPTTGQPQQQVTRTYYSEGNGNGLLHTVAQNDLLNAANDVTTTYFYDGAGRVIRTNQTATFGSCTSSFTLYDAAGNTLASVCNYTPGNLADPTTLDSLLALYNSATPELNRITAYRYDALNRRVQTTTNAGSSDAVTTVTVYDSLDRVIRNITNYVPGGNISDPYIHDRAAFSHGLNNDQNLVADTAYNERGSVRRQTDVLGNITLFGYDDADRLVKTVQSASQPDYDNSYGVNGDYSLSHYVPGRQLDQDLITTSHYDPVGNLIWTADVSGQVTLTGYDALNRPIRTIRNASQPDYDMVADPTLSAYPISSAADQDMVDVTEYDALGRVVRSQDTLGRWTLFGFDALGRQVKTIRHASQPAYDLLSDPALSRYLLSDAQDQDAITQTAYDSLGRVLYTTDVLGHRSWSVYDGLGRVVKTIANAVGTATNGGLNDPRSASYSLSPDPDKDVVTLTTYDTNGYVLWTQDALGNRTWLAYDSVGRQVKTIVNAVGTATDGGPHDPRSVNYVPSSDADKDLITQTAYDALGRVLYTTDVVGNRTWLAYDALGRRTRTIANAVGTATDGSPNDPRSFNYVPSSDADKDLITQTAFDDAGRMLWTQDALGRRTWLAYDAVGRQTKTIVNAVGTLADGSIHDPRAVYYAVSDDADKDLVTLTAYDRASRTMYSQDPLSHRAWVGYDAAGRQVRTIANATGTATDGGVTDPRSPTYIMSAASDQDVVTQAIFDKAGQVLSSIDALGNQTQYTYDGLGRRVKTLQNVVLGIASPDRPDQDLTSTSSYNRAGQLLATIDVRGTQTTFTYDGLGRRLTMTQAAGTSLAVTAYTCYDKAGRVLRTIQNWTNNPTQPSPDAKDTNGNFLFNPTDHGSANDQNLISTTTLDALGRQLATEDTLGNNSRMTYTKDGQLASMTDPLGVVTQYRYDLAKRRTTAVTNYQAASWTDPASWTWQGSAWQDGNGQAISFSIAQDQNIIVQTTYDKAGRMTALRDPRGNQTTYTYDLLNRRTSLADPLAYVWGTQYINSNNLLQTTVTDPLGHATQQTADGLGRLKAIQYLNENPKLTPDVTFLYDKAGNRLSMAETSSTATVRTTAYTYDQARRLRQVDTDTDGNGTIDQTVSYAYDAGGLRTRLTLPDNLSITYDYDVRGQLTRLMDWASQPTTYSYDHANRLATITRSNGLLSQYSYDAAGHLLNLHHDTDTQLLAHFDYSVDARGNRTQAIEKVAHSMVIADNTSAIVDYYSGHWAAVNTLLVATDASAALRIPFTADRILLTMAVGPDYSTYDVYVDGDLWRTIDGYAASTGTRTYTIALADAGSHLLDIRNRPERNLLSSGYKIRFHSLALSGQTYDWQTLQYSYDDLLRLTNATIYPETDTGGTPSHQYSYSYDLAGNRLNQVVAVDGGSPTTTNYTYDQSNRLQTSQINGGSINSFSYDNAGRITSDGVNNYGWDRANRLLSMGGSSYLYDGVGRRVQQTVAAQVTQYLLDTQPGLWQVLTATQGANVTRHVHGPLGIQEQQNPDTTWRWLIMDGLGSVRGVVDSSATSFESQLYDPYGSPYSNTGGSQTVFGFTGEPTDGNGLVQLRARYYSPTLGVFPSLDPLEGSMSQPMALNRYGWVQGRVTNQVDPSGWGGCEDGNCEEPAGVGGTITLSDGTVLTLTDEFTPLFKNYLSQAFVEPVEFATGPQNIPRNSAIAEIISVDLGPGRPKVYVGFDPGVVSIDTVLSELDGTVIDIYTKDGYFADRSLLPQTHYVPTWLRNSSLSSLTVPTYGDQPSDLRDKDKATTGQCLKEDESKKYDCGSGNGTKLFRAMTPDSALPNYPAISPINARTLNARPGDLNAYLDPDLEAEKQLDRLVNSSGKSSDGKGMSVSPDDPFRVNIVRRPPAWRGNGNKKDEMWCIMSSNLGGSLKYVPDSPERGVVEHGVIEPMSEMTYQLYLDALHATQSFWKLLIP